MTNITFKHDLLRTTGHEYHTDEGIDAVVLNIGNCMNVDIISLYDNVRQAGDTWVTPISHAAV